MKRMLSWFTRKWSRRADPGLLQAYQVTFGTKYGQQVMQHLIDEIYCQVCPSSDPIALATHNGRRSVVQEILENIDAAEYPDKYITEQET